jgi:hypothetical protein
VNKIDLESNTITYLRKQPGFPEESVVSIVIDDNGDIWMGTQQGLFRYQPSQELFTHFGVEDGLINRVYSERVCYKHADGTLFFGGDKGVDYFNPDKIKTNTVPPDLYLNKVLVNQVRVDSTIPARNLRQLTLGHNQNFLEIELLALHLTAPQANQYAYQIPEIDTAWQRLGTNRIVTLVNMQPGTYTLKARASNADHVWSPEKEMLRIRIKPPFWATWWFITCCGLLAVVLLAAAYRYRVNQIETREKLKSKFNKRIAELESKALRAQMNPHFLFNSINSVKSLISQGNSAKATQYLTRFGQLIRQVLLNSERPVVRLQEELEALRLYLEIEQLRFQNFSYSIAIDEGVNADFIEVPPLILQPYVENAIWHGLMHQTNGDRKLTVEVSREGDFLRMTIEDNGIGREKAGQMKMLGTSRKSGMGMRLTGDRLNLLREIYGQDVSVQVEDLMGNGKATGTRVVIVIPCVE